MKCKRCSKTATRKTNTAPKQGKRQWYGWYFHCTACGWLNMPAKASRTLHTSMGARVMFEADHRMPTPGLESGLSRVMCPLRNPRR
jgi:hypothetical protein